MPSLSLLIPACNEEGTVFSVISESAVVLERAQLRGVINDYEIIVLNDGSEDSTLEQINKYRSTKLKVISTNEPSGLQSAYGKLAAVATKEWVIVIPADGQWPSDSLENVLEFANMNGWKSVVIGARAFKNNVYGFKRSSISWFFRQLARVCLQQDVVDPGTIKLIPSVVNRQRMRCKSPIQEIERLSIAKNVFRLTIQVHEVNWITRTHGKATGSSLKNVGTSILEIPKLLYVCGSARKEKKIKLLFS
jgi:glycosyltransferase involved in cell wall biosynthesis